ncbi:unnamed protein product [Macrosiphum euphorbiae]|uniref:Nucleoplasmin-like domain-containing protein n=1 Tax=Macrosiphum euphorbiae TaxID=13131 RepID=A0AAV0XLL7_9HEMI|nr:unnamed protein product [Macrosiphum euphorbiae]
MPIDYYKFFSIVLEPTSVYPTRGVHKTFETSRQYIHLTSAVLDMDFESMIRPATFLPGYCENIQRWMTSKYTLKMNINGEESVLCHLHVGNNFQSNIDVHLPPSVVQSEVEFYCEETCRIHLNGKILLQ